MFRHILVGANAHAEIVAAIKRARPSLDVRGAAVPDIVLDDLAWADVYVGFRRPVHVTMGGVRWVHSTGAGVDNWLLTDGHPNAHAAGALSESILLTRSAESFGPRIAEWVVSRVLAFAQGILPLDAQQQHTTWKQLEPTEIRGTRAVVIGTGDIGRHVAALLGAFGVRVTGVSRTGHGDAAIFPRVVPVSELSAHVGDAQWIILTIPYTPESHHLFDRAMMSRCNGATLLNVGRGGTVEETAIVDALEQGWLRGAALDVFETEPLPPGSPLWSDPRVMVSPHVSGLTTTAGVVEGFVECLDALERGETPRWTVDRVRGY